MNQETSPANPSDDGNDDDDDDDETGGRSGSVIGPDTVCVQRIYSMSFGACLHTVV